MCDTDQRLCDLLMFSKMCAPKYNTSELSDRILVLDIMPDGWETTDILNSVSADESQNQGATSVSLGNTCSKRSLEDTEEPKLKRLKTNTEQPVFESLVITTPKESGSVNQSELSGAFQEMQYEQAENEIHETASEQSENKKLDDSLPTQDVTGDNEKPASPNLQPSNESGEIQKRGPLREHKVHVHSLWLSVQSTYFRSLLHSSGMKETHDTEVHIKISESEEHAHLNLLQAMYDGEILNDKTVDELLAVLELADKYDVKFVFKICKYILQKNATTFEIITKIMHVIKVKHNMNDVEDLATTVQLILAKEFSPLDENWESEKFIDLPEPSLKYLLSSDDLVVASENTVFHALMHWMEQNEVYADDLGETNNLLALVRFQLVTIDYLYNVIKNHPIASKMPKFNHLILDGMIYHAMPSEQKEMLEKQPVVRKKPEKNIIVHSYSLYRGYSAVKDTFWACGYKMSINTAMTDDWYYPHLTVHNLNKESLVPLKFKIRKTLSQSAQWKEHSFKLTSCQEEYSSLYFPDRSKSLKVFIEVLPL